MRYSLTRYTRIQITRRNKHESVFIIIYDLVVTSGIPSASVPKTWILPLAPQGINKYLKLSKCCFKRKTIGAAEIAYGQEQALLFQRTQPAWVACMTVHVGGSQLTGTPVPGDPALFPVYHRTTPTPQTHREGQERKCEGRE